MSCRVKPHQCKIHESSVHTEHRRWNNLSDPESYIIKNDYKISVPRKHLLVFSSSHGFCMKIKGKGSVDMKQRVSHKKVGDQKHDLDFTLVE